MAEVSGDRAIGERQLASGLDAPGMILAGIPRQRAVDQVGGAIRIEAAGYRRGVARKRASDQRGRSLEVRETTATDDGIAIDAVPRQGAGGQRGRAVTKGDAAAVVGAEVAG